MARRATGQAVWQRDAAGVWRWHARITRLDGTRPSEPIPEPWATLNTPESKAMARKVAAAISAHVRGGSIAPIRRDRHAVTPETVEEYAKRWIESRKNKKSRDNASHLKWHILPLIGQMQIARVQPSDVERVVAALDVKIAAKDMGVEALT